MISANASTCPRRVQRKHSPLPVFVPPRLSKPVEKPPPGLQWVHEIKLDGYRMAVRIDNGRAQLLTRTGLDWTTKYPSAAACPLALARSQRRERPRAGDSIRARLRDQRNVRPLALTTLMVTICESRPNVLDHLDDLHTNRRVDDP
jgi:hypothetical protein